MPQPGQALTAILVIKRIYAAAHRSHSKPDRNMEDTASGVRDLEPVQ
ncbi:MAG TPA: hypothetical protein VGG03_24295 [Thermoanaerobaculia bacterium]|jgi:hypothetical protein